MDDVSPHWQLLIVSLPSNSTTLRMRIWRALKALGCAALRDGVYLLPWTAALEEQLRGLADEVAVGGDDPALAVRARQIVVGRRVGVDDIHRHHRETMTFAV